MSKKRFHSKLIVGMVLMSACLAASSFVCAQQPEQTVADKPVAAVEAVASGRWSVASKSMWGVENLMLPRI